MVKSYNEMYPKLGCNGTLIHRNGEGIAHISSSAGSWSGVVFAPVKNSPIGGQLSPARLTAAGFLVLILAGTFLLSLPISAVGDQWTPFLPSFFTATSAVSLTGLIVEDTGT